MTGLHTILARTKVDWDLIVLTECWLPNAHVIPDLQGYNYFKTDNNLTQNEGVVVYVHKNLRVSVEEPTITEANCLLIKIDVHTILLAIYRPPSYRDITNFLNSLNLILLSITHFKNIIITGDININIHDRCNDSSKHSYLNLLASHGLLPAHTLPTRLKTCLDHFILKTSLPASTYVAHSALTDHETVLLFLNKKIPIINAKKTSVRINYDHLDDELKQLDFGDVYRTQNPHIAAEKMISLITQAIVSNSKTVKVPNRKKIMKPWLTLGLLRCIRHRDNLHKKLKKSPENEILRTSFIRYRNYCNKLLRKTKLEFEKKELSDAGNNTKQIWTAINAITNRAKKRNDTSHLLQMTATPLQSANLVNKFFTEIGRDLAENAVSRSTADATRAVNNGLLQSMVMLPTDEKEVAKQIMSLRNDCAAGWDRISSGLLKKHLKIVVPPLTYICNLALTTGQFPKVLKRSIIHPIFKGGDRNRVNNYRPIAVLPALSKILERIMNNRLVDYLEKNNILSPSQYGFRAGKSTSDAVHDLTNYVVTNMDRGKKVLGIFLDLAKAFDTVSVPILIQKMERLGIRGAQLKLFEDYLSERTQCVKIENVISEERTVSYGVPQGSVLGPTLFLIYINDLGLLTLPKGKIITFADDTALLFSASTWHEVYANAQTGFSVVTEWLHSNILTLNADKTKYIAFSLKKYTQTPSTTPLYSIIAHSCSNQNSNTCICTRIQKENSVKYLGIIIDCNLRFQEHIYTLSNRLRKLIYVFKTLRHVADEKLRRSIYFALVQSLLTYCITSWGGAPKYTILELERTQRAILKVSSFLPFRYPTALLYKEAKVLTVRQLFILQTVLKQHGLLTFNPLLSQGKRRFVPIDHHHTRLTTIFSKRFFCYLGRFLYNNINGMLSLYSLPSSKCKMKVRNWLQELNYDDTEKLLAAPV